MTPNRSSIKRITKRALKKCTKFYAATRRAIVRAAAEIGRTMK